ncbi:hypothetical protein ZHAS_00006753 [Anopheles sinensis]|uniref:Uncharacterized protein n=1 Tax=Anopheles sinensis TaxID=74873 RepID=A0A084VM48_ANOSI|nr:hypothetical protein ZHAS_00006753 [Anopheles sinensis]
MILWLVSDTGREAGNRYIDHKKPQQGHDQGTHKHSTQTLRKVLLVSLHVLLQKDVRRKAFPFLIMQARFFVIVKFNAYHSSLLTSASVEWFLS